MLFLRNAHRKELVSTQNWYTWINNNCFPYKQQYIILLEEYLSLELQRRYNFDLSITMVS